MIRRATRGDVPRCVEMSGRFIRETGYHGKIANNPTARRKVIVDLIEGPDGAVFVLEEGAEIIGMIGAFVFTHPMSGERIGCESFWWVEPEHRGHYRGVHLLKAAEAWAEETRAVRMLMIEPSGESRVGRLYQLLGYTALETQYQKDL